MSATTHHARSLAAASTGLFTVAVVVEDAHGSTYSRTYVRPARSRLGRQAFVSFAVGDLLGLVSEGAWAGYSVVSVEEVTA